MNLDVRQTLFGILGKPCSAVDRRVAILDRNLCDGAVPRPLQVIGRRIRHEGRRLSGSVAVRETCSLVDTRNLNLPPLIVGGDIGGVDRESDIDSEIDIAFRRLASADGVA